ncbi:MAG: Integrin alpha beta-propellor repeat protein [Verrucomicrobiales bacterium]|nr:Integrin alpha beta-propellor repeat protein [Verrucomicrobiales bacterium]
MKASNIGHYEFGNAVSISGDTIAVSAWKEDNHVWIGPSNIYIPASGAVYLYTRFNGAWSQVSRLTTPQPRRDDAFGGALGLSGGTMVIGAPGDDSSATGINGDQLNNAMADSGAAHVFVMNGSGWSQQAYLKASNTGRRNSFGQSVGIAGNTIVIGSPGEGSKSTGVNGDQSDRSFSEAGSAYVFAREGSAWSQQAYLKASNTASRSRFGWSASVSGDIVVVAADQENRAASDPVNNIASNSGAAYVFQRTGTAWIPQAYLKASNADASDRFGTSAAVSGNVIAVGAANEASTATGVDGDQTGNSKPGTGAAYLFEASPSHSPPVLTVTVPENQTVTYADRVILHAEVSGLPFPDFQWHIGSTGDTSHPIPGANWKTLATPTITTPVTYWLRATNSVGSADSPTITLNPVQSPLQLWRTANFGYPDNTGAAADTSDPDEDGSSNLDEFIAGTAPTDHSDAFGIISCGVRGQGTFTVTVFGTTGRTYQLVRSAEPRLPVRFWQPVAALESTASDGPVELTDFKASSARIFYRVLVSKP